MTRHASFALCVALFAASCSGPRIYRDHDDAAKTSRFELGPFSLGALGIPSLELDTEFSHAELPPLEEIPVNLSVGPAYSFQEITFFADGEKFNYRRRAFTENEAWLPLSEFLKIGHARHVGIRFDDEEGIHNLSDEDMKVLNRFAAKVEFDYERARVLKKRKKKGTEPQQEQSVETG